MIFAGGCYFSLVDSLKNDTYGDDYDTEDLKKIPDSATTADIDAALRIYCQPFVLPRSDRICLSVMITAAVLLLCDAKSKIKTFLTTLGILIGGVTIIDQCTSIRARPLANYHDTISDGLASRSVL